MIPQSEVDSLVSRIRSLVKRFGGDHALLEKVRLYYSMFSDLPEAGSFVILEKEVERIEKDSR